MGWPVRIRAVVFDMDGTLVESRLDYAAMKSDMELPPDEPVLESLARITDPARLARCHEILDMHERRGAEQAVWINDAESLLATLRSAGLKLGIVTRNSRVASELVLSRLACPIQDVMTRDDAPHKPDPTAIRNLCQRWSVAPSECVMVGDYLFDILAGRGAGCGTVLFAPDEPPEYAHEADHVVTHLRQIEPLLQL